MNNETRKRKKLLIFAMLLLFLVPNSSVVAHADMGPKDSLTVYVTNPPQEEYYLDLLVQNLPLDAHDNLAIDDGEALDSNMLDLLFSLEDEGWLPALAHGTSIPMWGNLIGKSEGDKMKHTFGYYGLPDTYRIIIVTKSGQVSISKAYTRKALQSSITYNYQTKTASVPSLFSAYSIQFLTTFSLTILIEGVILLLFRYNFKKNWLVFLLVNLATQILMTLTVGIALIKSGSLTANLILVPVEIGILGLESISYRFLLKGRTKKLNTVYGIVANLASWLAGFVFLNLASLLIISFL